MGLTIPGSNSCEDECFLSPPRRPNWLWSLHNLLVSMYWPSSSGVKRSVREPNSSPVSSVEVKMLSKKCPLLSRFRLNEQQ